jgi:hypothetical protein
MFPSAHGTRLQMKQIMMTNVIINRRVAAISSLFMTGYATDLSQTLKPKNHF